MRTVTTTTTLYLYEELSPVAQANARDWYRDAVDGDEWWGGIYDDAKQVAALMGIEIDNIYFSGFSSQGDGAQFTGNYSYPGEKGVKAVREYAPKDAVLLEIAEELDQLQGRHNDGLTAEITPTGRYSHEYCTRIDVSAEDDEDEGTEAELTLILRDFMRWIYRQLKTEYEYLRSDETVADNIIANDYEFTSNGVRSDLGEEQ